MANARLSLKQFSFGGKNAVPWGLEMPQGPPTNICPVVSVSAVKFAMSRKKIEAVVGVMDIAMGRAHGPESVEALFLL